MQVPEFRDEYDYIENVKPRPDRIGASSKAIKRGVTVENTNGDGEIGKFIFLYGYSTDRIIILTKSAILSRYYSSDILSNSIDEVVRKSFIRASVRDKCCLGDWATKSVFEYRGRSGEEIGFTHLFAESKLFRRFHFVAHEFANAVEIATERANSL